MSLPFTKWLSDSVFRLSNALAGLPIDTIVYDDDDKNETIVDLQVGKTHWHGVPARMRTELWLSQLHRIGGMGANAAARYRSLSQASLPEHVSAEIEKDLHRTFPGHKYLSSTMGQRAMCGVLRAYAIFDEEIGYTQGMNFLAGLLLTYIPEEADAFGALVVLMHGRGLRALYLPDMSLLQVRLWQLGKLMSPSLLTHLESHGALPVLFAPSWFITCFAADFPIHFAARVMDLVITDSCTAPLMRVALALLDYSAMNLKKLHDLEDILEFLKIRLPRISRLELQELLTNALGKPWSSRHVKVLEEMNGAESVANAVRRVDAAMESGALTSPSAPFPTAAVPGTADTTMDPTVSFSDMVLNRKMDSQNGCHRWLPPTPKLESLPREWAFIEEDVGMKADIDNTFSTALAQLKSSLEIQIGTMAMAPSCTDSGTPGLEEFLPSPFESQYSWETGKTGPLDSSFKKGKVHIGKDESTDEFGSFKAATESGANKNTHTVTERRVTPQQRASMLAEDSLLDFVNSTKGLLPEGTQ